VETGEILAIDGSVICQRVESICVHSDTPDAARIAGVLRAGLESAGVSLTSFISGSPIG
jgi:UPF0271 protein